MKYFIDGICSDDIIKDYKIKKLPNNRYNLYIIYLDKASEKNTIRYNLTEKEVNEYQEKLNDIMIRQMNKFIALPNNLKAAEEQQHLLTFIQILLSIGYIIILYSHKEESIKASIDTILYLLFNYILKKYYNNLRRESSFEYMDDLEKYRFYAEYYNEFLNIGIYPNMVDNKTLNELEVLLRSLPNQSKVKVNILNANFK